MAEEKWHDDVGAACTWPRSIAAAIAPPPAAPSETADPGTDAGTP